MNTRLRLRLTPLFGLAAALLALPAAHAQLSVQWITQYGSSGDDVANALTVDGQGQIWATGYTTGSLGGPNAGSSDVILSRLSPAGSVDFTRHRGGASGDVGRGVALMGSGAVFISGVTGSNFDGMVTTDNYDNFSMRYDVSGNWQGTTRTGSTGFDQAGGVAGNSTYVLAAGYSDGSFDGQSTQGTYDAFLTKRDSTGALVWTRFAGTSGADFGQGTTFDSADNAYLAGKTFSSFAGFANAGSGDAFVARYNAAGNRTLLQQFGTSGDENASDVKVDANGNIYVSGYTHGPFGSYDCFLTKLSSAGTLLWTRYLGGSGDDEGKGLGLDSTGHVWIGGFSSSTFGGHVNAGSNDAFVAEYDTNGNLLGTTFLATAAEDTIFGLAMGQDGAAYVTGYTRGALAGANAGGVDIFVAKLVPEPSAALLLVGAAFPLLLGRRRR